MPRIQSASSINIFKECPRKYYYAYIEERTIPPNAYMVRGNIVHSVLEKFFDNPPLLSRDSFHQLLQSRIVGLLTSEWKGADFSGFELPVPEVQFFEETLVMVLNWLNQFTSRLSSFEDLSQGFKTLTPIREQFFISNTHKVRGFVDAIEQQDGVVHLIDYKTSRDAVLSEEYRLQLAIYSLLYKEKYGKIPDKISLYFLREGPLSVHADESLVEFAKNEAEFVHRATVSDDIQDYPKRESAKCRFCDFQKDCSNC